MAGAAVPPLDPTPALEDVVAEAVDWAIGHGLVVRPPPPTKDAAAPGAPPPPLATHAPISLVPTPFPRAAFEHARALQPAFNRLVHAVSRDRAFLDEVVASLAGVDDFTARLHQIYVEAEAHAAKTGIRQVRVHQQGREGCTLRGGGGGRSHAWSLSCRRVRRRQPVVLGLHRSDYLLHAPSSPGAPPVLQQVELNTIASSFSSLSAKVGELHRYLVRSACLDRPDVLDRLPPNAAGTALADGIATAWALYQQPRSVRGARCRRRDVARRLTSALWRPAERGTHVRRAVVVMVVQPNERNAYDQRWIQDRLTTQYGSGARNGDADPWCADARTASQGVRRAAQARHPRAAVHARRDRARRQGGRGDRAPVHVRRSPAPVPPHALAAANSPRDMRAGVALGFAAVAARWPWPTSALATAPRTTRPTRCASRRAGCAAQPNRPAHHRDQERPRGVTYAGVGGAPEAGDVAGHQVPDGRVPARRHEEGAAGAGAAWRAGALRHARGRAAAALLLHGALPAGRQPGGGGGHRGGAGAPARLCPQAAARRRRYAARARRGGSQDSWLAKHWERAPAVRSAAQATTFTTTTWRACCGSCRRRSSARTFSWIAFARRSSAAGCCAAAMSPSRTWSASSASTASLSGARPTPQAARLVPRS